MLEPLECVVKAPALPFDCEKLRQATLKFTSFIDLQTILGGELTACTDMVSNSKFARENPKHHENSLQLTNQLRTENADQGKKIQELEQ
jgi:hypothetical protein